MLIDDLLIKTLNIEEPFYIEDILFDDKEINIYIGSSEKIFECPTCLDMRSVHDKKRKRWRHIDALNHEVYVNFPTPRVKCEQHGVQLIEVQWAKKRHHFTKEMELHIFELAQSIPLKYVGEIIGEHDTRVKRIILGVKNEKDFD